MERIPIPPVFAGALDDLPLELGRWLDRQNPVLVYEIVDFVKPTSIKERRIWSIKKIAFEFARSRGRDMRGQENVLGEAVVSAISTLSSKGIIAGLKKGKEKSWPFGKNSSFKIKDGEKARAVFFATLVEMGERAGFDEEKLKNYSMLARTLYRRAGF